LERFWLSVFAHSSHAAGHRCAAAGGVIPLILGYQKSGATPTDYHANPLKSLRFGWDTDCRKPYWMDHLKNNID
jgi:hypothetical protein